MQVNVDEGFLQHFTSAFCERYGSDSAFVHAVSDLFTAAASRMMKEKNLLVSEDTIAWFGSEAAEETLQALVAAVDGSISLFQEAIGVAPLGSFGSLVDAKFGEKTFSVWLDAFQAEQFAVASNVIKGNLP